MAQYSGINAVLDSSQKGLRTMKSNRLTVFAASLQWADAVKVGGLGNLVVGVCRGERRRKGREGPNSEA